MPAAFQPFPAPRCNDYDCGGSGTCASGSRDCRCSGSCVSARCCCGSARRDANLCCARRASRRASAAQRPTSPSRSPGSDSARSMVTVLPDNPIGDACVGELRRHGVDVQDVIRQPGRMGLYFLARGALLRPAEVIYDRAGSAFAAAEPAHVRLASLLSEARLAARERYQRRARRARARERCSPRRARRTRWASRSPSTATSARRCGAGANSRPRACCASWRSRAQLLFANVHDAGLLFDVDTRRRGTGGSVPDRGRRGVRGLPGPEVRGRHGTGHPRR